MEITVNGKRMPLPGGTALADFLADKENAPDGIVVELNQEIVKREKWTSITLKENDILEILRLVGGG
ncbi:MAG: sulfur carrier protein ThiS [Peptococcaceae bacterium]|nr:sulfur carrier protein ThiS [Peptococcaceae bacterium]MDH7525426.1 sulfur carrier protein ThiS [Peptococcaceae bacterium]